MKLTYDRGYNIAYIRLRNGNDNDGVEAVRVSDEMNVDIAPDGTVYGIEFLNANEQLREGAVGEIVVINEATVEETKLTLTWGKA